MPESRVEQFQAERQRLNELVMQYADLSIKRFFNLDSQVYREALFPPRPKRCWVSSPRWCSDAMIALPITLSAVLKKG